MCFARISVHSEQNIDERRCRTRFLFEQVWQLLHESCQLAEILPVPLSATKPLTDFPQLHSQIPIRIEPPGKPPRIVQNAHEP